MLLTINPNFPPTDRDKFDPFLDKMENMNGFQTRHHASPEAKTGALEACKHTRAHLNHLETLIEFYNQYKCGQCTIDECIMSAVAQGWIPSTVSEAGTHT